MNVMRESSPHGPEQNKRDEQKKNQKNSRHGINCGIEKD